MGPTNEGPFYSTLFLFLVHLFCLSIQLHPFRSKRVLLGKPLFFLSKSLPSLTSFTLIFYTSKYKGQKSIHLTSILFLFYFTHHMSFSHLYFTSKLNRPWLCFFLFGCKKQSKMLEKINSISPIFYSTPIWLGEVSSKVKFQTLLVTLFSMFQLTKSYSRVKLE